MRCLLFSARIIRRECLQIKTPPKLWWRRLPHPVMPTSSNWIRDWFTSLPTGEGGHWTIGHNSSPLVQTSPSSSISSLRESLPTTMHIVSLKSLLMVNRGLSLTTFYLNYGTVVPCRSVLTMPDRTISILPSCAMLPDISEIVVSRGPPPLIPSSIHVIAGPFSHTEPSTTTSHVPTMSILVL